MWGYLSDKLGIPVADLSKESAQKSLEKFNIEKNLIDKFIKTIDDSDFSRYAPDLGSININELYKQAIDIISKLEQKLR